MSDELTAVDVVANSQPYRVPRAPTPVDLYLDGNEGATPPASLLAVLEELDAEDLRRYPSTQKLEELLAKRLGLQAAQVLVTAGADDAIDRACRAVLGPGRNAVVPVPTFEMVPRFAAMTGASVRRVQYGASGYPLQAVLDAVDDQTGLVVVISPNNPTGITATLEQIATLSAQCPRALILVDHAYVEFSEHDVTEAAVEFPNVLVTKTLSKAWGLAGMRVGYAVGQTRVVEWLRTAGGPYPVSRPSLVVAARWLENGQQRVERFVDRVVDERRRLSALLDEVGGRPVQSQANFVFARVGDGLWWRDAMAGLGIGVRAFPGRPGLEDAMRIACPGSESVMERLEQAIRIVATPQAILFDLDGVFADVSKSYRQAVIKTAASYGVQVDAAEITAAKAAGDANNDWRVTRNLLADRGVQADLEEVTRRFEEFYQGTGEVAGLWQEEQLLAEPEFLRRLRDQGVALAIVTGRPRRDARRFVEHWKIGQFFDAMVCMEDAALKPDPAPVRLAMERLGIERAWFVGDTPDDMRAGRAAGVLPLGIVAPEEDEATMKQPLLMAGAGRVLDSLDELFEVLP